jgi:ADP-ribose pyrophosphatase
MYTIIAFFRQMVAYDGKIISVEHWQVKLPDGREAFLEVMRHPGAAAFVPVDNEARSDEDKFLLIKRIP